MNRLFGCTVSLIYEDENGRATVNSLIADRTELWWTPNRPDQAGLWESKIELSEKFFQEIIRHPVPIDINTLTALKRSTLGLDLYLWLVYRTFALRAPLRGLQAVSKNSGRGAGEGRSPSGRAALRGRRAHKPASTRTRREQ